MLSIPGNYHSGGITFLDLQNKSYAVGDDRVSFTEFKLVPTSKAFDGSRVQRVDQQELLSYFCVSGQENNGSADLNTLYSDLHYSFNQFIVSSGGKVSKSACTMPNDKDQMSKMVNTVLKISKADSNPKIKDIIKQCILNFLKDKYQFVDEYNKINRL